MNPSPTSPDDVAAVRALLSPMDPVPDTAIAREEVLAARASVGLRRAAPSPVRQPRGRLLAAGAVAVLSVATLLALVVIPASDEGGDTVTLATGPGAQAVNAAYASTAAAGTARGMLTVTSGGRTATATGVGSFDGGAAQAEIALTDGSGGGPATDITVIRTRDAIFAKLPGGANPLAAGKPWVSVDAATLTQVTQMVLGDMAAQVTGAPLDALAYLRAVSGDVQVVGPDATRGEPTTHYRGTVDPQKVASQLPAAIRPDAAQAGSQINQTLPTDLWIDDQGRLRKLVLTADVDKVQGAAPGSGLATVTVELWDFGITVEVTAPPADQVVDVGGLLGGFLGGRRP